MPHHDQQVREGQRTVEMNGMVFPKPVSRPSNIRRRPENATNYMNMLLDLDAVPKWHNIAVAVAAWLLLAGFVIYPGTFTSIQSIDTEGDDGFSGVERWVLSRVKNLPLLVVASICCGAGGLGMVAFWIRWRNNYVWVCNRVFMPGTLHALAGILSTIINVYTAQDKQWSITAKITVIVESACLAVCGSLFLFYSNWMLERVKRKHDRQLGAYDDDLGFMEKARRKARQPSPEAGRVV